LIKDYSDGPIKTGPEGIVNQAIEKVIFMPMQNNRSDQGHSGSEVGLKASSRQVSSRAMRKTEHRNQESVQHANREASTPMRSDPVQTQRRDDHQGTLESRQLTERIVKQPLAGSITIKRGSPGITEKDNFTESAQQIDQPQDAQSSGTFEARHQRHVIVHKFPLTTPQTSNAGKRARRDNRRD